MFSISIITIMGVLAGGPSSCKNLSIAECTSEFNCGWLPTSGKCSPRCRYLNQTECDANSGCYYYDGGNKFCTNVEECSERMLADCYNDCGIVAGQNICRSCSSATTNTDCGRMSECLWNGKTCGQNEQVCDSSQLSSNSTLCMETGCIWDGNSCHHPILDAPSSDDWNYCFPPDFTSCTTLPGNNLCETSNTTNCIRYKNDLVPCSELTTRPLCMRQATCEWNTFSQSCVDTDLCSTILFIAECQYVGCTPLYTNLPPKFEFTFTSLCTNAAAYTRCPTISDKATCNKQVTCAFFYEGLGNATCYPVKGCEELPESVCTEKPDCWWDPSSNTCGDSGRPCGEIRMLCGGEKCKNMVRDPDMTEYSVFGTFHDRQLVINVLGFDKKETFMKNGIPCIDCPVCQPGYVWNIAATIQCGADGIGSFGQQVCVLPGDYSDGTGTPDKPDFPVTGVPTLAPVSTGVPTGVPTHVPGSTGTPVKPDVPVTGVPTLAPGSTGAPHTPERTGAPSAPSHGTGSPDGGNNGTVAPATPDGDGDNGDNKIIIIIVAGSVLLLVIVLVFLAFKFCNKNNIKRENHFPGSNDGYTHELCE